MNSVKDTVVVKISPVNPTTVLTEDFYFSDRNYYGTEPSTPAIKDSFSYQESIAGYNNLFGGGDLDIGDITLVNSGGVLDHIADYGFDGQVIEVYKTEQYADSLLSTDLIFKGVMKSVEFSLTEAVIAIQSPTAFLEKSLQTSTFAGPPARPPPATPPAVYQGGEDYAHRIEGDEDVKGKRKPMIFGRCLVVEPVLLNSSYQIYGTNYDSAGNRKFAHVYYVMDGGASLVAEKIDSINTFFTRADAGDLDYGYAYVVEDEGLVCLTSEPEKTLTVCLDSSTNDPTPASVITEIIGEMDQPAWFSFDLSALSSATTEAAVGIHIDGSGTALDAIQNVLASIGGGIYSDNGTLVFDKLENPLNATAVENIDSNRYATDSLEVDSNLGEDGLPIHKVGIEYNNLFSSSSSDSLLGAAGRTTRSFLTEDNETAYAESAAAAALHKLSVEKIYKSVLVGARPCLIRNTHFEIPLNLPLSSYLAGWVILEGEYTRTVKNSGQATITLPDITSTMTQELFFGSHIDYGQWDFTFTVESTTGTFSCFVEVTRESSGVSKVYAANAATTDGLYTCSVDLSRSASDDVLEVRLVVFGEVTMTSVTGVENLQSWTPEDEAGKRLGIHTGSSIYYLDYLPRNYIKPFSVVTVDTDRFGATNPVKCLVVGRTLDENTNTQSLTLLSEWDAGSGPIAPF